MAAVGLGVNADHIGHIRAFNISAIEHLLPDVVELVGKDAPLNSQGIIGLLSDNAISDFGEPPDA